MRRAVLVFLALCLLPAPPARAQGGEAQRELVAAIRLLREQHINRDKADWEALRTQAEARLAGERAQDAWPAIRFVIAGLGEKHTFLIPADVAAARRTGQRVGNAAPPPVVLPKSQLVGEDVGLVALKSVGQAAAKAYAVAAQDALAQMGKARICRYIVDLRGNLGGNMYPMMYGLVPLLGQEPYGYFFQLSGAAIPWRIEAYMHYQTGSGGFDRGLSWQRRAPVAVLIDRRTVSAGEDTAIAFKGRDKTRFFGENSGGYVTGNATHPLPSGAMLAISSVFLGDRNRVRYDDMVRPDEVTEPGDATLLAAVQWLRAQPCEAE